MNWQALTSAYAKACEINYYAARADIEARRQANGDEEARRWLERFLSGEKLAWSNLS